MIRGMFERAFSPDRVDEIFEEVSQRQYTRELRFSTVVDLMMKVVFDINASVGAAYRAAGETMSVSEVSGYHQLNGVEPAVAVALVAISVRPVATVVMGKGTTSGTVMDVPKALCLHTRCGAYTRRKCRRSRILRAFPWPASEWTRGKTHAP